jgi:hypothetical protein
VLVLQGYRGRGKVSGLDVGAMRALGVSLFHVRHGKMTKIITSWDRERALADLGLGSRADNGSAVTPSVA